MNTSTRESLLRTFRVAPGRPMRLKDHDPAWAGTAEMKKLGHEDLIDRARVHLEKTLDGLADAQELLWASNTHAVLIVFQAMDAAGKDGTIKHVMRGVNPQGCRVHSFKRPSTEELDHPFLWRQMKVVPPRGMITIFNRSHYEDVIVTRVHPELLGDRDISPSQINKAFWAGRYDDINAFERHLVRSGTVILKFFLNVSKEEQRRRFLERLENDDKHWKFSHADVAEREHWDEYMRVYELALSATSTAHAPWFVIPADHKWITRTLVAEIVTKSIKTLRLAFPTPSAVEKRALVRARNKLKEE